MVTRAAAVKWWRRGAEAGHEGCKAQLESALLADEPLNSTATAETGVLCREAAAPTVTPAAAAGEAGMQPPVSLPAAGGLEAQEQGTGQQSLATVVHLSDQMLHDTFSKACEQGHLAVVRELLGLSGDRRVDVHAGEEAAFRGACGNGHVGVVRELLGLSGDRRVDVHAEGQGAFRGACWNGHVGVVRELLGLSGDRRVDVHAGEEDAFLWACRYGHLGVVRELLGLSGDRRVDVHAGEEGAFHGARVNAHLGVVRELLGLSGDRRVDVHAGEEGAFRGACGNGHLGVVRELLALTGDRVMCTCQLAAAALLAAGPTAPASPADAALWAGVAAADGLMRSGAADGRMVSAARGGYVVWSWGRRRSLVVSRVSRRGGGDGREVWVDGE